MLWKEYSLKKQTQEQIGDSIGKSREWVNRFLKTIEARIKQRNLRPTEEQEYKPRL